MRNELIKQGAGWASESGTKTQLEAGRLLRSLQSNNWHSISGMGRRNPHPAVLLIKRAGVPHGGETEWQRAAKTEGQEVRKGAAPAPGRIVHASGLGQAQWHAGGHCL